MIIHGTNSHTGIPEVRRPTEPPEEDITPCQGKAQPLSLHINHHSPSLSKPSRRRQTIQFLKNWAAGQQRLTECSPAGRMQDRRAHHQRGGHPGPCSWVQHHALPRACKCCWLGIIGVKVSKRRSCFQGARCVVFLKTFDGNVLNRSPSFDPFDGACMQWLRTLLHPKIKSRGSISKAGGGEWQAFAVHQSEPLLRFALCSGSHSDPAVRTQHTLFSAD